MGAEEILVSGGVAAILAAVVGGGLKAFGVELPLLASVQRQGILLVVGVALIGLGLFRPSAEGAGEQPKAVAAAPAQASPTRPEPDAARPPAPAAPATRIPPISELQFLAARQVLLRSGWSPVGQGNPMHNENIQGGNGPMFREMGFTEVAACAPTGLAECMFVYRNDSGQVLHVGTVGEGESASVNDATIVDCAREPDARGC
jgi:hypothetical protein